VFILNVVLYLYRYLARRISKKLIVTCVYLVLVPIKNHPKTSNLSAIKLVNIKPYGDFTHPDYHKFLYFSDKLKRHF